MKKVLSFVLVLSLVLGSFGMAFAAAPVDVVGEKSETAVNVLVNMEIINGYPDGTFKPEGIVTRAEMSKILVTALGLGDMVSNTASSFTDTAGHWADGFIAYASSLGMIVGYPDGSFQPDGQVTYEEAATMMVRSLGYDDRALLGTWPGNYVTKAVTLGLYKDVKVASGAANRGDIALMTYELLDEGIGKVREQDQIFEAPTVTVGGNVYYTDNMLIRYGAKAVTVANGTLMDPTGSLVKDALIDMTDYIGRYVNYYVNDDNEIIAVTKIESKELTGKLDRNVAGTLTDDKLEVNGKKYNLDYSGSGLAGRTANQLFVNADQTAIAADVAVDAGTGITGAAPANLHEYTATVIGDISGSTIKVDSMIVWVADGGSYKVTNGDVSQAEDVVAGHDDEIFTQDLPKTDNKVDFKKFTISGDVTKLDDIKKDDIVAVYLDDASEVEKIQVTRKVAEGKVTKINTASSKVYIDGEEYKLSSVSNATTPTTASFTLGSTVAAKLNAGGKIVDFKEIKAANAGNYGLVVKTTNGNDDYGIPFKIQMITTAGEKVTFEVAGVADAKYEIGGVVSNMTVVNGGTKQIELTGTAAAAGGIEVGDVVEYETNSAGKIVKIIDDSVTAAGTLFVKRTNTINGKDIASNAVIFKLTGTPTDSKVIPKTDLKDEVAVNYEYFLKDGDIVAAVVAAADVKTTDKYAVVKSVASVYDDELGKPVKEFVVLVDGSEATYRSDDTPSATINAVAKHDLIKLVLKGGRMDDLTAVVNPYTTIKSVLQASDISKIDTDKNLLTKNVITQAPGADTVLGTADDIFTVTAGTYDTVEYYEGAQFYLATFTDNNVFDGWVVTNENSLRIGYGVFAQDLLNSDEDALDTTANVYDTIFIVRTSDSSKL